MVGDDCGEGVVVVEGVVLDCTLNEFIIFCASDKYSSNKFAGEYRLVCMFYQLTPPITCTCVASELSVMFVNVYRIIHAGRPAKVVGTDSMI